jgi:hypothetical protein
MACEELLTTIGMTYSRAASGLDDRQLDPASEAETNMAREVMTCRIV